MENYIQELIQSYDRAAAERDKLEVSDWKKDLRWKFLKILKSEGKSNLIDIGAGTGIHGKFFLDHGIDVTCVDLSPAHVDNCLEKGLTSYVLNIFDLDTLEKSFDCAFALNSLLHISSSTLPAALTIISKILKPHGLFLWGQYGGEYREGVFQDDHQEPKRFFCLLNDEQIIEMASLNFSVEVFERIELENMSPLHFQFLILRVKSKPSLQHDPRFA